MEYFLFKVFNNEEYCGDFEQFELANEIDSLEDFLKLPPEERPQVHKSTLDTSKIDENHPNGKVIEDEDEKPADENKENKTEDQVWIILLEKKSKWKSLFLHTTHFKNA